MVEDAILTIEEVAKYLRVSERTVYDWAQKGEIPAGKIGTVWRFKKTEIENWVSKRLTPARLDGNLDPIQVRSILSLDRILFLNHSSKHDTLLELAANLATAPQIKNSQELALEIMKREELMSTAIGKGIAIPHVRLHSVTDIVVSVGISSVDVEGFNPLDDEPVRLIVMIAAAYNQHANYLQALSYFSSRLKKKELCDSLLKAKSKNDAYRLFVASDGTNIA